MVLQDHSEEIITLKRGKSLVIMIETLLVMVMEMIEGLITIPMTQGSSPMQMIKGLSPIAMTEDMIPIQMIENMIPIQMIENMILIPKKKDLSLIIMTKDLTLIRMIASIVTNQKDILLTEEEAVNRKTTMMNGAIGIINLERYYIFIELQS